MKSDKRRLERELRDKQTKHAAELAELEDKIRTLSTAFAGTAPGLPVCSEATDPL